MQYRAMGKTGVKVSALGYGCMRFPVIEQNDKEIDEAQAAELLRYAIDNGVNYVDTAYFYHGGNSEIIVGKALENGYREKVNLATKLPVGKVECEEDVEKIFFHQLEKLRTDHIDFYLLHAMNADLWENKVLKFDILPKLEKLKADGKIGHIGFSFHDNFAAFKKIVDGYDKFEFCQIQFNYVDTDYQAGIDGLEYAASKGLGVIVMEPLRGGKLADPADEIKAVLPDGKTPVEAALDFVWNRPEVSLLLSGMGSMQMVKDNILYAGRSGVNMLGESDIKAFAEAKKKFDAQEVIPCTGCRYCTPCPSGVMIPRIFAAFNRIAEGGRKLVVDDLPNIEEMTLLCRECGECVKKCPQHIDIPEMLKKVRRNF